jgi:hypothetical protein
MHRKFHSKFQRFFQDPTCSAARRASPGSSWMKPGRISGPKVHGDSGQMWCTKSCGDIDIYSGKYGKMWFLIW